MTKYDQILTGSEWQNKQEFLEKVLDTYYSGKSSATFTIAASNAKWPFKADEQCRGVYDDEVINAALNAVGANVYGGKVQLSEGIFVPAAPIYIPDQGYITLRGMGPTSTQITLANGANCVVIAKDTPGTTRYRCRILDLGISGNSANNPTGTYGIDLTGMVQSSCENIRVDDCKSHGFYGSTTNDVSLRRCWSVYNEGAGYFISNSFGWVFNSLRSFGNASHGMILSGGGEHVGSDLFFDMDLNSSLVLACVRTSLANVWTAPMTQYRCGIHFFNAKDCTVSGGIFYPPSGADASTRGIYFEASDGNSCSNNILMGYHLNGSSAASVIGVRQDVTGTGVIEYCVVTKCHFASVTPNSTDTNTYSVKFSSNQGYTASGDVVTLRKDIDHADIIDDGGATGHIDFDDEILAGSVVKAVKCDFTEAWDSDNTATLTMMIGYVGDLDAFNLTADPGENAFNHTTDVFWGESDCQAHIVTAAKTPRITFTEDDDITHIISGAGAQGKIAITLTYMKA